jgi:hypothetical protein
MIVVSTLPTSLDVLLVIGGWVALFPVFAFRALSTRGRVGKQARRSLIGMALQGVGFSLVFGLRRPAGAGFLPLGGWVGPAVTLVIALLVLSSIWLINASLWRLGRQWSLVARVVEGHELVTTGPYCCASCSARPTIAMRRGCRPWCLSRDGGVGAEAPATVAPAHPPSRLPRGLDAHFADDAVAEADRVLHVARVAADRRHVTLEHVGTSRP